LKTAGLSVRQIATELMVRQVPTPSGGKWHAQTVLRAMSLPENPVGT
jgi:Recombinase